jgi:uncharacterized repeat protein (TIGR01451 family)
MLHAESWPVPDEDVESMVRQAVAAAGGLESVIAPGDTVVIKPNLVVGADPDRGYTTDPRVVRAVVELAREAGAGEVIIAEGAGHYSDGRNERGATVEAFHLCGFDADGDMIDDVTGAPLVDLNDAGGLDQHDPALVTEVIVPNGLIWTSYWLPRVVMEADVLIGVPVMKNHGAAGVTLALKNQFGIAPSDIYHAPGSQMYKSALNHGPTDLGRHIVDLNLARPLDFVVLDALRGMINGPEGGTLIEPPMGLILAGSDAVAVDTVGTLVMGYDPATIPYLSWAAGAGLGTDDVAQITVLGTPVSQARRDFPAPCGDPQAQRAEATPPTLQIVTPGDNAFVTDEVFVLAEASDDTAIAKVVFTVNGEIRATVTAPPYEATLDLGDHRGESVTVETIAYDYVLNQATDAAEVVVISAPEPGTTSFQTATLSIPTYPFDEHGCVQARADSPYTYPWLDWSCYAYYNPNPAPVPQDYTLLVLENDYLRVSLMPELGGRIYQLVYKATGNNELYQNPVIKPTNWGPPNQGWWLAVGGIEWCFPVDEHGYEWGIPWAWDVITSTTGVTVTVQDSASVNRLQVAVDVFLPADRAALSITPHIMNPTASDMGYKFWLNAMLAPGPTNRPNGNFEFAFNAETMSVHSTGDDRLPGAWPTVPSSPNYLFDWPVYNGVDFSRLGNWDEWLGFFEYPRAAGDFIGLYNRRADEGVARVFPAQVAQGAKGFATGWAHPIDSHQWTDDDSGCVELHGGVAPTFWDTAVLAAGETLSWSEWWYPVGPIGALSDATDEAALGVRQVGTALRVGVHTTAPRPDGATTLRVWDRATCAELHHLHLPALSPESDFITFVSLGDRSPDEVAVVLLDDAEQPLAAVNPVDCLAPHAAIDPLPHWVPTADFSVTWSGWDSWSGIAAYNVQVRDGYEGTWTDWLTEVTTTSAVFAGTHGHTYLFRVRARDAAGNWSAYNDNAWEEAFTTVLTEPAPVLVRSTKAASPWLFRAEQAVSYTIVISNTGNLVANAVLTDTLPPEMVLQAGTLSAPAEFIGGAIHWSGTVAPGESAHITYTLAATSTTPLGTPMTNTVEIAGSVLGQIVRQQRVVQARTMHLPLIMLGH